MSLAGIGQAAYMLAYRQRIIDSIACPLFGEGCQTVGRSRQSALRGIPNAAIGIAIYALMAILALLNGDRWRRTAALLPLARTTVASCAVAASVLLVREQAVTVRAWCFWCLTSGLTNLAIFLLCFADAGPALRAIVGSFRRFLGNAD